jgi:2-iminoacetate synthase ThiH
MAGSSTPTSLSTRDIEQLIWDAGREPIERDTLYNVVRVPPAPGLEVLRS